MAPPRENGDTGGPVLRSPGAWIKAGGPATGQVLPSAAGVVQPPRRAERQRPEEVAGRPGGDTVRA